jgi:hypothetical protein
MYKQILVLLISTILLSCSNQNTEEIQALHKKVMNTHDEVMPKMDDIHDLKKQLSESLKNVKDSTQIFNAITQLDNADEAMMVWMDEFNQGYTDMKHDEQKSYLATEYEIIKKVKLMMLESLDNGKQILENGK